MSMVVYWMMIFWLKQSDTWKLKQSDTCVNGGLLNDDILIKTNVIPVSMVVYWMMILWLKQSDTWKLKQSDTCVNGGLLNDDTLIKTKWYLCQWWFIEWWYFD